MTVVIKITLSLNFVVQTTFLLYSMQFDQSEHFFHGWYTSQHPRSSKYTLKNVGDG